MTTLFYEIKKINLLTFLS